MGCSHDDLQNSKIKIFYPSHNLKLVPALPGTYLTDIMPGTRYEYVRRVQLVSWHITGHPAFSY